MHYSIHRRITAVGVAVFLLAALLVGQASSAHAASVAPSAQANAQAMLNSGRLGFGHPEPRAQIEAYASGSERINPATGRACNLNDVLLAALKQVVVDEGMSISINSLNRWCEGINATQWWQYHSVNFGGHAVDVGRVNNVASTGATSQDIAFISAMTRTLPTPAGLGQLNCGQNVSVPSGWTRFDDTCNHVHVEYRGADVAQPGNPTQPTSADADGDAVADALDLCSATPGFGLYQGCAIPRSANSTDFNGDGTADVFFAHPNGQWWVSDSGTSAWRTLAAGNVALDKLQFGDFNGDSISDVFYPNPSTGAWLVSYGGTSAWSTLSSGNNLPGEELQLGDFDGDGKTDVLWANAGASQWWVSYGGNTAWTVTAVQVPNTDIRVADLNGDSKDDVFWGNPNGAWMMSSGANSAWQTLATGSVPVAQLKFGDVNGDGKDDVFWPNPGTGNWQVSYGGTSAWQVLVSASVPGDQLQLADLTGDNKVDAFWPNVGANAWWMSSGASSSWQGINSAAVDHRLLVTR